MSKGLNTRRGGELARAAKKLVAKMPSKSISEYPRASVLNATSHGFTPMTNATAKATSGLLRRSGHAKAKGTSNPAVNAGRRRSISRGGSACGSPQLGKSASPESCAAHGCWAHNHPPGRPALSTTAAGRNPPAWSSRHTISSDSYAASEPRRRSATRQSRTRLEGSCSISVASASQCNAKMTLASRRWPRCSIAVLSLVAAIAANIGYTPMLRRLHIFLADEMQIMVQRCDAGSDVIVVGHVSQRPRSTLPAVRL